MGYNYFNCGNMRSCRIFEGNIEVKDSFDRVFKLPTGIKLNTDWQCNLFWNSEITFLLKTSDGSEIIGYPNGGIMIRKDNLLVGMNTFEPKQGFEAECIGYAIHDAMRRILLDMEDRQTIYLEGKRYEAMLPKKFYGSVDLSRALAKIGRKEAKECIMLVGGEEIEVPVWSIQKSLRIGACDSLI